MGEALELAPRLLDQPSAGKWVGSKAPTQFLGFIQPCCSLEPEGQHQPLERQQGGLGYKAP